MGGSDEKPVMGAVHKLDCKADIDRVEALLKTGIFSSKRADDPLHQAAFTEIMIHLRDLLVKAETYGVRVIFTEYLDLGPDQTDVTDVICAVRDCCCQTDTDDHRLSGDHASYDCIVGIGTLTKDDGVELESEYQDDIAYFYGGHRLYLRRNMLKSFERVKYILAPLIE